MYSTSDVAPRRALLLRKQREQETCPPRRARVQCTPESLERHSSQKALATCIPRRELVLCSQEETCGVLLLCGARLWPVWTMPWRAGFRTSSPLARTISARLVPKELRLSVRQCSVECAQGNAVRPLWKGGGWDWKQNSSR